MKFKKYYFLTIMIFTFIIFTPVKAFAVVNVNLTDTTFYENYNYYDNTTNNTLLTADKWQLLIDKVQSYITNDTTNFSRPYYLITFMSPDWNTPNRYNGLNFKIYYFTEAELNNATINLYTYGSATNDYTFKIDIGMNSYAYRLIAFNNWSGSIVTPSSDSSAPVFTSYYSGWAYQFSKKATWTNPTDFNIAKDIFSYTNAWEILKNKPIMKNDYSGSTYDVDVIMDSQLYQNNQGFNVHDYFGTTDEIAPVITLNGDSTIYIDEYDVYTDLGATALDDVDGDLTSNIIVTSNVNPKISGTYQVTYEVSDNSGNVGQAARTIIVNDKYKRIYYKDLENFDSNRTTDSFQFISFYLKDVKKHIDLAGTNQAEVNLAFNISGEWHYFDNFNTGLNVIPNVSNAQFGLQKVSNISKNALNEYIFNSESKTLILPFNLEKPMLWSFKKYHTNQRALETYVQNIYENTYIEYNSYELGYSIYNYNDKLIDTDVTDTGGNNVIDYIDENGNHQVINDSNLINPIYSGEVNNTIDIFNDIYRFIEEKNMALVNFKTEIDNMWAKLPTNMTSFLTFIYAISWVLVLIYAIRK